jgi:hypothetical protein
MSINSLDRLLASLPAAELGAAKRGRQRNSSGIRHPASGPPGLPSARMRRYEFLIKNDLVIDILTHIAYIGTRLTAARGSGIGARKG